MKTTERLLAWWSAHVGPPELLERWGALSRGPVAFPSPDDDVVVVRVRGPIVSSSVQEWMEEDGREAVSGDSFARQIAPAVQSGRGVLVLIDSPGGSVTDAARIRTEMVRARQAGVPSIDGLVEGAAWSAATVVMALCDEVAIEQMATVMVHQPRMLAYGTAAVLRDFASSLEQLTDATAAAYERRIGAEAAAEILGADQDKWFSAQSAIDIGFCDLLFTADDGAGDPPDEDPPDEDPPDEAPASRRAGPLPSLATTITLGIG